MSGPIMRGNFATQQLVYLHPDPVPTGAELEVGGGETLILTFNGKAQDPMGPGVHSIFSPSYRVVQAYFVLSMPAQMSLEGKCEAQCAGSGKNEPVGFRADAQVQASNAKRLVEQLAEIPVAGFAKGMSQRISDKLGEIVSAEVTAASGRTGTIAEAVVDPAAKLLIATLSTKVVNEGIDFPGLEILELNGVMMWAEGHQPAAAPPAPVAQHAPAPAAPSGAPPSNQMSAQMYANGTRVYAAYQDQWYPAVVVGFADNKYQVDWEGNNDVAWVAADQVRPA